MEIDIQTKEKIIDTWPLVCHAPGGRKYNGKCIITRDHIYYDVEDMTGRAAFNRQSGFGLKARIHKSHIKKISNRIGLFSRKIIITMQGGERYIFSYRTVRKSRVIDAIKKR